MSAAAAPAPSPIAPAPTPQRDADPAAPARLSIDLGALAANYRALSEAAKPAACAAVVKADAYGIGASAAVETLSQAGCDTFFVATIGEAIGVRAQASAATIYVFNGLYPRTATLFQQARLRPVLNSPPEVSEWVEFCRACGDRLPAAIHIDTGMNRLGMSLDEARAFAADADARAAMDLTLVMSHLACSDDPDHPANARQLGAFEEVRGLFDGVAASLANSGGIMLGAPYHHDLVRPGIALYGGRCCRDGGIAMQPVVRLEGRIVQVRDARDGDAVGYGAARTLQRASRIATVSVGYADGYMRLLGGHDDQSGAMAYVDGHRAPIVGRVSMDLIGVDVSDVPDGLAERGGFVELLGPNVTVDDLAARAQTIGYEVLTSLGRRAARRYIRPAS